MKHPQPARVGIIGCGNISSIYCQAGQTFDDLEIVACADLDLSRAEARAAEYQIPRALSVAALLADPEIDIVINLTIPAAHFSIAEQALRAGKSVHNEKPLSVSLEDGRRLLELAREKNLRVGCAPDTFLGAALQTCRKLIDDGAIGQPVAATAFMLSHGPENWHPDPEFFYQTGGGPMFDMGPYYLTALVSLLGPVRRIAGATQISFPERTISSEKKRGQILRPEIPTHVAGLLDFQAGAVGTIITSFDIHAHQLPPMEIHGSLGTLAVPDPNNFGDEVRLKRAGEKEWTVIPHTHGYAENSRGIGVADLAAAIRTGRPHRASGDLALHVLQIMHGIHLSSSTDGHYFPQSTVERPAPFPLGLRVGAVEL